MLILSSSTRIDPAHDGKYKFSKGFRGTNITVEEFLLDFLNDVDSEEETETPKAKKTKTKRKKSIAQSI